MTYFVCKVIKQNKHLAMITTSHKTEFWFHVSNQEEIPIFGNVDKGIDIPLLLEIIQNTPLEVNDQTNYIKNVIRGNADSIDILRTFVGVSDKRMYLELSYIFGKAKFEQTDLNNVLGYSLYDLEKHNVSFFKSLTRIRSNNGPNRTLIAIHNRKANKAIEIISEYLISKGIITILLSLKKLNRDEISSLIDNLIIPKEIQQAETKRRGHGAEWQLAILLSHLGILYIPDDKHVNPMSSDDPNVDKRTFQLSQRNEETGWSFDLIIKENPTTLRIFIQGLIHTSDPGQYGVNKSGETVLIKQGLTTYNQTHNTNKELWGLVDGVGFIENPEHTVFKMLNAFDTFIQLKSLYKAGLKLHQLGLVRIRAIKFDTAFYSVEEANAMFAKYGSPDIQKIIDNTQIEGTPINAGKAWLYL